MLSLMDGLVRILIMFCRNDSEILGLALEALCNITSAETQGQQGIFHTCTGLIQT